MESKYEVSAWYKNGLNEQSYFNTRHEAEKAMRKLASLYVVTSAFLWDQTTNTMISSTLD